MIELIEKDSPYGRCYGCNQWTRHFSPEGRALCMSPECRGPQRISPLTMAMARVLSDYRWQMFCDAWLAIGLAAYICSLDTQWMDHKDLGRLIGRVRAKR